MIFKISKTNFYEPVTFIVHSNDYYKRQDNTYKLKIFSIEEIKKGGSGVISVLSNAFPKVTSKIVNLCLENKFKVAKEIHDKYLYLIKLLFIEPNPIPIKEAMNYRLHGDHDCY